MPGAQKRRGVLDGDTHPQVRRPRQPVSQSPKPERSLGEYLVGVLRGVGDHCEDLADEAHRDPGVEQIVPTGSERRRALSRWDPLEAVGDTFCRVSVTDMIL